VAESCKLFPLTTGEPGAGENQGEPAAVAGEIEALYSKAFGIDLAHVESLLESNPAFPDRPPERIAYDVYRMAPGFPYGQPSPSGPGKRMIHGAPA